MKNFSVKLDLAITALKHAGVVKEGKYDKEFKSYISSFGASVLQSGLKPTVAFYSEKGGANTDRQHLLVALMTMMSQNGKMYDYLLIHDNLDHLEDEILNNAIALKLALRLFEAK